jgi:hypothetical protein
MFVQVVMLSVFLEVLENFSMMDERLLRFVKWEVRKRHYFFRNIGPESRNSTQTYRQEHWLDCRSDIKWSENMLSASLAMQHITLN